MICVLNLAGCSTSDTLANPTDIINIDDKSNESTTPIPVSSPPSVSVTITAEAEGCKIVYDLVICIQNVMQTESETQVKLKILVESNMVSGSGNSFIFPDAERELYPVLFDEQGHSYSLKDNADNYWAQFDEAERVYFQTLYFEPIPADGKKVKLSLPMVTVDSPSEAEGLQLDLGTNPQPGQVLELDVTTTVDGQTLHFVKAEFEGDGINSLRGTFYTDPLNLPEHIYSMTPLFVEREKGVLFGLKWGTNGLPLRIFADLVIPPGKSSGLTQNTYISGVLNLELERITYWYRGPFEITFPLSKHTDEQPSPTPQHPLTQPLNNITVEITSAKVISTGIEIGICYTTPDNGEWRPMPGLLFYDKHEGYPDEIEFLEGEILADGKNTGTRCALIRYRIDDLNTLVTPVEFSILKFYAPGREMYTPCQELQQRLDTNPKAKAYGLKAKCVENSDGTISATLLDHAKSVSNDNAKQALDKIAKAEVVGPWEFTINEIER